MKLKLIERNYYNIIYTLNCMFSILLTVLRMDFEAIPLYNKNILRPATSEEFRDI